MPAEQEGASMKLLKPVVSVMAVLVLVGFLASDVWAEKPPIKDVKNRQMWGDPDYPLTKGRGRVCQDVVLGDGPGRYVGFTLSGAFRELMAARRGQSGCPTSEYIWYRAPGTGTRSPQKR